MSADLYDVIVTGAGSMGSAACFYLAERGYKVLGLEQFDKVPHENGSHAGQSRIIRKAYFEHPDYVPLLERAYHNWHELEQLTGEQVYFRTGLLYCGPRQHEVMRGVKHAASAYNIEVRDAAGHAATSVFKRSPGDEVLLEPDAGFLLPEKSIALYISAALKKGAAIKTGEKVLEWKREGGVIKVLTSKGSYYARKLIITAGAWAEYVTRKLAVPLKVTRQLVLWVEPGNTTAFTPDKFPCWMLAGNDFKGVWYGFPYLSGKEFPGPAGLKFALHHPGDETGPDEVNRQVSPAEIAALTGEAKKYFKPAGFTVTSVKICLYTNTWDEHFIIGHLPGYDGDITIACGFSGHGFKFASVVGEVLADLSMTGQTVLPVEFLGLKRFQQNS